MRKAWCSSFIYWLVGRSSKIRWHINNNFDDWLWGRFVHSVRREWRRCFSVPSFPHISQIPIHCQIGLKRIQVTNYCYLITRTLQNSVFFCKKIRLQCKSINQSIDRSVGQSVSQWVSESAVCVWASNGNGRSIRLATVHFHRDCHAGSEMEVQSRRETWRTKMEPCSPSSPTNPTVPSLPSQIICKDWPVKPPPRPSKKKRLYC